MNSSPGCVAAAFASPKSVPGVQIGVRSAMTTPRAHAAQRGTCQFVVLAPRRPAQRIARIAQPCAPFARNAASSGADGPQARDAVQDSGSGSDARHSADTSESDGKTAPGRNTVSTRAAQSRAAARKGPSHANHSRAPGTHTSSAKRASYVPFKSTLAGQSATRPSSSGPGSSGRHGDSAAYAGAAPGQSTGRHAAAAPSTKAWAQQATAQAAASAARYQSTFWNLRASPPLGVNARKQSGRATGSEDDIAETGWDFLQHDPNDEGVLDDVLREPLGSSRPSNCQ